MAVAYVDHTLVKSSTTQASDITFEHVAPAGTDRALLVIAGKQYNEELPTTVTFDGNALTAGGEHPNPTTGNAPTTLMFYKVLGTSGSGTTADIVLDISQWYNYHYVVAVNLTGVDQADPIGAIESSGSNNFNQTLNITTDTAASLLFGGIARWGDGATADWSQNDGQTEDWDDRTGDVYSNDAHFCGSHLAAATAQAYSFGATKIAGTGYGYGSIVVVEVHEAAAGTTHEAAASVSGAGSISADGALTLGAAGTASGAGSVAGSAALTLVAAAAVAGAGTSTSAAVLTLVAAASVAGAGSISADAALTIVAAASAVGAGSATATAGVTRPGAAAVAGAGTSTGIAAMTFGGAGLAAGAGAVAAAAVLIIVGAASVAGAGTATGTATVSTHEAAASVTGVGTATGTAKVIFGDAATMSVSASCGIFLRERGNESGNLFNVAPYVTTWSFQLLRRNGCGPATFTAVMTDSEWAALEAQGLLVADTVVHFYLNMNEAAAHRTWSGTLKSFPLDKNTPPSRRVRKFTCAPVWSQLKKPGCLLLRAFDADETVQAIVQGLVSSIAADTDVHTATTNVTAGYDFSPGRTLFIDQEAAQCVEKSAQVYGDVVSGISGQDDKLYFVAETNDTAAPQATFRMGTHDDGVVKFTRTTQVRRDQANHYIVEGREAKSGNPMTVEYEDPDLATDPDMIRRTKKVQAPDNVKGATLLRWAQYLVARDKGPKTVAVLTVAGIDTKFTEEGDVIRTWSQLNGNIAVEDEDANALGQWPIQGVTYSMDNEGGYGAKFELGDALKQDIVDAFGMRDTLREIAVHELKEFSNQIELNAMNDDWNADGYVWLVLNHGMRNSVRVSLQSLKHIDFDHNQTTGIITEAVDNGVTGLIDPNDETLIGQFVTQQIPVGMSYDEWALLRNVEYPRIIEGQEDAGSGHFWRPTPLPPHYNDTYNLHWEAVVTEGQNGPESGLHARPLAYNFGNPTDYYSVALHKNRIHPTAHIDWVCRWRRARNEDDDSAYLVFGYTDRDNYHFIELTDDYGTESLLRWRAGKYTDGVKTYTDTVVGSVAILLGGEEWRKRFNFRVEPDPSTDMYVFRARRWNLARDDWDDWVTQAVPAGWYNPTESTHAVGVGQRWDQLAAADWDTVLGPSWLRITFDSCVAGDEWYLSRDDGDSWEGPFDPDTGGKLTLGAYAGGGTEKDYILIKGYVAAPQILAGYAGGWK